MGIKNKEIIIEIVNILEKYKVEGVSFFGEEGNMQMIASPGFDRKNLAAFLRSAIDSIENDPSPRSILDPETKEFFKEN